MNAFLIEQPQGLWLVDAGQTAAAAQPGYFPAWHPFFRLSRFELSEDDEVAAQIAKLGFVLEDVGHVVLTHLHTDHVGALADFCHAQVIVSEAEWIAATGLRGRVRGYVPQHWPVEIVPTRARLTGPPIGPFPASLDLAGDGSLRLVPLPGHTRGQIGVLAGTPVGSALLAGDAAHDWSELQTSDPRIADYCRRERIVFLAAHDDGIPLLIEFSDEAGLTPTRRLREGSANATGGSNASG